MLANVAIDNLANMEKSTDTDRVAANSGDMDITESKDVIDMSEYGALGMIETEGYIAAICSADAAVKSANVRLLALGKVGSAIVTVMLVGDIGAVQAAVDAGREVAAEVGVLRTSHVIPRLNSDVARKMIHPIKPVKVLKSDSNMQNNGQDDGTDTEILTLEKTKTDFPIDSEDTAKTEMKRKIEIKNQSELLEKSNNELKAMIVKLEPDIASAKLKTMRKEELINYLNQLRQGDKE